MLGMILAVNSNYFPKLHKKVVSVTEMQYVSVGYKLDI